jgi:hypothetical protein
LPSSQKTLNPLDCPPQGVCSGAEVPVLNFGPMATLRSRYLVLSCTLTSCGAVSTQEVHRSETPPAREQPAGQAAPRSQPGYAEVAMVAPLRNVEPAPFRVALHPGAVVRVLNADEHETRIAILDYRVSEDQLNFDEKYGWEEVYRTQRPEELRGTISTKAIGRWWNVKPDADLEQPPRCAARAGGLSGKWVRDVRRLIVSEPTGSNAAIQTNGGAMEILGTKIVNGVEYQQVRQFTHGVELSGWTPVRIGCMQRLMTLQREWIAEDNRYGPPRFIAFGEPRERATPDEEPLAIPDLGASDIVPSVVREPNIPPSYQLVQKSAVTRGLANLQAVRVLYAVELVEEVPVCAQLRIESGSLSVVAEANLSGEPARLDMKYSLGVGSDGQLSMDGPTIKRTVSDAEGDTIAFGCTSTSRVLGENSDGILLGGGAAPVVAYDPADAVMWYYRKETCESALIEASGQEPESGRERLASAHPVRTLSGC